MTNLKRIKICTFLILFIALTSCREDKKPENINEITPQTAPVREKESNKNVVREMNGSIRSIFQDKDGNYWFGTNSAGVYRYDGKMLIQYTVKDGLYNEQVQTIQEDKAGNIWFGTGLFGVSRFDGQTFTSFTNKENLPFNKSAGIDWKTEPGDLWFYAGGGVYRYNGHAFFYLPLDKSISDAKKSKRSPDKLSLYTVYSTLKDKKGNIWIGTQSQGVCRFDGKSLTWFTEKGLAGSAVLALLEDSSGQIWCGNNGAGLFRFDGKSFLNFTDENGLDNKEFKVSAKAGPNTLARISALQEDIFGNIWIGTVDAGAWKYDGKNLTHYNTQNGLASDAISVIYKDRNGGLWFGTNNVGISTYNGTDFEKFEVR